TTSQQQFYEKIGFQKNSTTTMVLYNQSSLSSVPTAEIQLQES
ncbi:GNAT family N-acetyltransferase, partial [Fischerella thermalis WC344]